MQSLATLTFEGYSIPVGHQEFMIPFTHRKGMTSGWEKCQKTIRGFMETLVEGDSFNGTIIVRHVCPRVQANVKSLILSAHCNDAGLIELHVVPTDKEVDKNPHFANENGLTSVPIGYSSRNSH